MSKEKKATTESTTPVPTGSTTVLDPFDRFGIGDLMQWPAWFGRHWPERRFGDFDSIKIERFVDDDTLVIRGEIPGVDPEDIELSIDNNQLTIQAERRSKTETDDDNGYRSEFHYGSFARVLPLPEGVNEDDVKASYVDGILEVRIPVDEDSPRQKKSIEISRGDRT
ncbi:MAG: Hsp20/alpha crystallin family protein [Acidimicrobiales bacterium]